MKDQVNCNWQLLIRTFVIVGRLSLLPCSRKCRRQSLIKHLETSTSTPTTMMYESAAKNLHVFALILNSNQLMRTTTRIPRLPGTIQSYASETKKDLMPSTIHTWKTWILTITLRASRIKATHLVKAVANLMVAETEKNWNH